MTRYSMEETSSKAVRCRGSYLRVHFKNTHEVCVLMLMLLLLCRLLGP
jgi:hypothetical protein